LYPSEHKFQQPFPQAKGMEEAKLTAGDSTVDGGAIANTPDVTKALPVQAGAASPGVQTRFSNLSADH
jgi:hypothetical protein